MKRIRGCRGGEHNQNMTREEGSISGLGKKISSAHCGLNIGAEEMEKVKPDGSKRFRWGGDKWLDREFVFYGRKKRDLDTTS